MKRVKEWRLKEGMWLDGAGKIMEVEGMWLDGADKRMEVEGIWLDETGKRMEVEGRYVVRWSGKNN